LGWKRKRPNRRFGLVIVVTTFASLVIGELVPKAFACAIRRRSQRSYRPPDGWLSKLTARSFGCSTRRCADFQVLGLNREDEEIRLRRKSFSSS
jgi:putative hemolysin